MVDVLGLLLLLFIVLAAIVVSQYFSRRGQWPAFISRKVLHIAGVGALSLAPLVVYNDLLLAGLVLLFTLILFFAIKFHWLGVDIYNRPSWGIALFPVAFLLLWWWWGREKLDLIVYPMLVLTLADAGAALIGKRFGRKPFNLTGDPKTLIGSFSFSIICAGILIGMPSFLPNLFEELRFSAFELFLSPFHWVIIIITISIFASFAEATASGGWDNVTIPLSVSWLMALLPGLGASVLMFTIPVLFLHVGLGYLAFKKKWLNEGGAVVAGMMGMVIWLAGGWPAWVLVGLFFVSGSLLSKLESENKSINGAKIGKPRDYWQVMSNGLVAMICMVWFGLTHGELPLFLFCVSVAVSTADTWSSSFGNWASGKVVDIFSFNPLPVGISGGVSWQGTLAGLAGAAFIGAMVHLWISGYALLVIFFGFLGMLTDSAMGSLWQVRYFLNGKMSEEVSIAEKLQPQKGLKWMSNDLVNVLSNLIITILAGIFGYFLGIRG